MTASNCAGYWKVGIQGSIMWLIFLRFNLSAIIRRTSLWRRVLAPCVLAQFWVMWVRHSGRPHGPRQFISSIGLPRARLTLDGITPALNLTHRQKNFGGIRSASFTYDEEWAMLSGNPEQSRLLRRAAAQAPGTSARERTRNEPIKTGTRIIRKLAHCWRKLPMSRINGVEEDNARSTLAAFRKGIHTRND